MRLPILDWNAFIVHVGRLRCGESAYNFLHPIRASREFNSLLVARIIYVASLCTCLPKVDSIMSLNDCFILICCTTSGVHVSLD